MIDLYIPGEREREREMGERWERDGRQMCKQAASVISGLLGLGPLRSLRGLRYSTIEYNILSHNTLHHTALL